MFHKRQPKQGGAIVSMGSVARRALAASDRAMRAQMELAETIRPPASRKGALSTMDSGKESGLKCLFPILQLLFLGFALLSRALDARSLSPTGSSPVVPL
jgi:hypothetical protein